MGTTNISIFIVFLNIKAFQCCVPLPIRPTNPNITSSTTEVVMTTTFPVESGSKNQSNEEKGTTSFSVINGNSPYVCTYEFNYNLNTSVNILNSTHSKCEKDNNGKATVGFLEQHNFEVTSTDGIELSCSIAAVYVKKDETIELVDSVVRESIQCIVNQGTCLTKDGPHFYAKCSFPYIFNGREYQGCTDWPMKDVETKGLWCATETDDKKIMKDGHWGWCSGNCGYCGGKDVMPSSSLPTTTSTVSQVVCNTETGKACHFPFVDGDKSYSECADWKSKYFWCATSVNSDLSYKTWEKCDMSTCGPELGAREQGSKGTKQKQPYVRSVEKCGYDCLVNTKKKMDSGSNEKLIGPTTIFEKEQLSNPSYNFVSDSMLQFTIGQQGIDLQCDMGRFKKFDGEKTISVTCTGDGNFQVVGQASGEVWENVKNNEFGCNPCPGFKSLVGSMRQNTNNIILRHDKVETIIECIYLCEESNDGCGVISYSTERQSCTLYQELDLTNDKNDGEDFICQAEPCQWGCEDIQRVKSKRKRFSTVGLSVGTKTIRNELKQCVDHSLGIPLYTKVVARYASGKANIKRFKGNFVTSDAAYDSVVDKGPMVMSEPPNHGTYTGEKADRGHVFASEFSNFVFKDLSRDDLSYLSRNMVNIIPQHPDTNRKDPWRQKERELLAFTKAGLALGYTVTIQYGVIPGPTKMGTTEVNWPSQILVAAVGKKGTLTRKFGFTSSNPVDGKNVNIVDLDANAFKTQLIQRWVTSGKVNGNECLKYL